MNLTEDQIETALRNVPRWQAPSSLKERLVADIPLPERANAADRAQGIRPPVGWLRRWWPIFAPGCVCLACAVIFTVQQQEIRRLREKIQPLTPVMHVEKVSQPTTYTFQTNLAPVQDTVAQEQNEIARLRELAGRLSAEVNQLEELRAQNNKLRSRLATPLLAGATSEEQADLENARQKALSIACINNLKQFGLAVRIWALDNTNTSPPDVLSMSNELSTPKILACPAETARPVASNWASFSDANCSYQFLVPNDPTFERFPMRVLVICPIHGHIGLCDGSVQGAVAKSRPDSLVQRDGKLYFEPKSSPQPTQPGASPKSIDKP